MERYLPQVARFHQQFFTRDKPCCKQKMFASYHQPTFVYGMDTINLNKAGIDSLEQNYRKVIKSMLCLPDNTSSVAVYLTFGILPFETQRDLEILGLLGQIAVCS